MVVGACEHYGPALTRKTPRNFFQARISNTLEVKVADLGCAELKWVALRFQDNASRPRTGILNESYCAPDVLLGNKEFGPDADMWSFGCVAAELFFRKPLFLPSQAKSQRVPVTVAKWPFRQLKAQVKTEDTVAGKQSAVRVLTQQARLLGAPAPDSTASEFLTSLPNVPKFFGPQVFVGLQAPNVFDNLPQFPKADSWPPKQLQGDSHQLADLVQRALRWSPARRLSAEEARAHSYVAASAPALALSLKCAEGKNGLGTIAEGFLQDEVLEYLQKCDGLAQIYEACLENNFAKSNALSQKEGELRMKGEFVGYVDANKPPKCKSLNTDTNLHPIPSQRLQHFVKALRRGAKEWLHQLTMRVRTAIRREKLPAEFLTGNGQLFMEEDFADNAFVYASIQLLRIGARYDGWHTDGGASLLHAAFTLFGMRSMLVELNQPMTDKISLPQRPGSFYVGNLCALNHNVQHHAVSEGNFSQGPESEQVRIAVLLRTDVYR